MPNSTSVFTSFENNHDVINVAGDEDEDDRRRIVPGMSMRIGINLPDLNDPNKTITRAWGKAPAWRTVYHGLNLEGTEPNLNTLASTSIWVKTNAELFYDFRGMHKFKMPSAQEAGLV